MAFDGITISNLVSDFNRLFVGGRIVKIAQPEKDELQISIKNYDTYKLLISADASLPLIYVTGVSKESPMTAPGFCMLLRKHFNSARIISVSQPDFERVIDFSIEHLDEMGDACIKHLMVEIMGKHSNIILCDKDYTILDSIKRVPSSVSSVREVLPMRPYFIPKTEDKQNPMVASEDTIFTILHTSNLPLSKAIYSSFTGISPLIANEICCRASADPDIPANVYETDALLHVAHIFTLLMEDVRRGNFFPNIITKEKEPLDYASVRLSVYDNKDFETAAFDSVSSLLEHYYAEKNRVTRIRQKSIDLRKLITTLIERESKKYDLQCRQLADTQKKEQFKKYGELLTVYGYEIPAGSKEAALFDYTDERELTVPLDPLLSPLENAKKYYEKYSKLKRTAEALTALTETTKAALTHLESVRLSLDLARGENDLNQIKEELIQSGYQKKAHVPKGQGKKVKKTPAGKPLHYQTANGYDLFVGKNNFQNEYLTFSLAENRDWWFHAKKVPGSHVILRNTGGEIPDSVFEAAAGLAAYYSGAKETDKLEIDYVERKHVKKPNSGAPGFVIYHENYSMMAVPSLEGLTLMD